MRERDMLWSGFVVGLALTAILIVIVGIGAIILSNRVLVTEWRDVSVPHQSATFSVPRRVMHLGVEYDCTLLDSLGDVPIDKDHAHVHVHDWSKTLNASPVSGAECLDCGEVAE